MKPAMTPETINRAIAAAGLAMRGVADLTDEERSGALAGKRQVVLIGLVGRLGWDAFARSAEAADGAPHPLDRWSRRVLGDLAAELGALALFPFGDPPFWPFQRWAMRAEPLHPSPLGLLIHPEHGLWHSYRGALAFADEIVLAAPEATPSPCESCSQKPCLSTCPVEAFSALGYDVGRCSDWLRSQNGDDCMARGCRARAACPVAPDLAHRPDQAGFGMQAFLAARD